MTTDEMLANEPSDVRICIEKIAERAGTYDADWSFIKAAGDMLNESYKRETELHKTNLVLQERCESLRRAMRNSRICYD